AGIQFVDSSTADLERVLGQIRYRAGCRARAADIAAASAHGRKAICTSLENRGNSRSHRQTRCATLAAADSTLTDQIDAAGNSARPRARASRIGSALEGAGVDA